MMKPKTNRKGNPKMPSGFDCCQTPVYALDPLLPYCLKNWTIWEPATGEGNIENALIEHGCSVIGTDILTGRNFFEWTPVQWDALVTNPPYSIKYEWLGRCYALGRPFALLLPVETLGAVRAQRFFEEYGLELILLSRRINFKMPQKGYSGSGAQFPVAWFTYGLGIGRQISFSNISIRDEK